MTTILFKLLLPARLYRTRNLVNNACGISCTIDQIYSKHPINGNNNLLYSTYKWKTKKERSDESQEASKEKIIKLMNFQSSDDAVPFYKLPNKTLMHIYKVTENDEKNGFCKNRLYYLSSKLNCPPSILSGKLAQRTFVYSLSFDWLESSLKILLDMGVSGDRIVRDLWVLKYHKDTIRERLQRIKNMGIDNLYPWMVRCSEEILNRYINICQETKTILGEAKTTQIYLANRLNIDQKDIDDLCHRVPALKTIRVTKVKHFLDFLIEQGFDVENIASKPRVLCASQQTVEQRLKQLRKLGLNEINLNVLCRSKKDFNKYVESIESIENECNNT